MQPHAHRLVVLLAVTLASGPLLYAPPSGAVAIDWVTVGDPGNAPDNTGIGAVATVYRISKYEVTNAQYAEFLNAMADSDPKGLYNTLMGSNAIVGGITRSGTNGSFTYSAKVGFASKPVVFVSFYDSLRFANWLHNGQPTGAQDTTTTEDGAYTITAGGISTNSIVRNVGATSFLTNEDEWYKAAYYDAISTSYFEYPVGTDSRTGCVGPGSDTGNSANCDAAVGSLTDVGAYTLSASPSGTLDQGGNVWEWNEAALGGNRRIRAGGWTKQNRPDQLAASFRESTGATFETISIGFRVGNVVPEPSTGLLVIAGLFVLGFGHRARARSNVPRLARGRPVRRGATSGRTRDQC